ncbi:MAG TPA: NAD(P)H-hydrate epimerase, partial [Candidatus Eisenbacteria bacterium]|nr:NAD(P)H-hydrate epimerase [Candidatus Eisenbacteria bacterium]
MRTPSATSRLVTAEEMAGLDRAAIETRGIPSLTLMERAGKESARAIVAWWRLAAGTRRRGRGSSGGIRTGQPARGGATPRPGSPLGPVLVFCGRGNNGGDGFVVARHLKTAGFTPRAIVAAEEESLSPDARANLDACFKARIPVTFLPDRRAWGVGSEAAIAAESAVFLVDALLGTGSRGAPREAIAAAIELMTLSQKPIASIDIPSGVDATTGHASLPSIRADLTLTL